ncbi:polysaccharide deacetylase family protein [Gramella sp. AN32]|uniref:Polysaccharide deacetylase family protein n=1 Tax=Christiangramia antarctica TaxID=2058158 RepID=A0ABW5X5T8_9FLAO|nr:polysaccharide deacetylase family protein [Gramella sp. AN32]MCM4157106.1 polysaccharide deacetylase [Gramella sp. AN32]
MKKQSGKLIISLDFELLWGIFDHVLPGEKDLYFSNTKTIIPKILNLFEDYGVHSTWAIVGMLFNKNWKEWRENIPENLPSYQKSKLSAYNFSKVNLNYSGMEEQLFSPELILKIRDAHGQEVGTHTYSHYYCLEKGQSPIEFKDDIKKSISIARNFDVTLKSLVFPRNQMNVEYLRICHDLGIENVRSNPGDWYWKNPQSNSLGTKIARSGDAYLNLGDKSYSFSDLHRDDGLPLQQPASRFLRPVEANSKLRKLKMDRIFAEMEKAAKKDQIYHLWWHPHNFGDHPEDSLEDLRKILEHFKTLHKKFNFQSLNMKELGDLVK